MPTENRLSSIYCIEAEVTFLATTEGGRVSPPYVFDCVYRPHIVIGDPHQRKPVLKGNWIDETMIGVCFLSGPGSIALGQTFAVELGLMFWPDPFYDLVVPGATFTTREGATIVGFGSVIRHIGERPLNRLPNSAVSAIEDTNFNAEFVFNDFPDFLGYAHLFAEKFYFSVTCNYRLAAMPPLLECDLNGGIAARQFSSQSEKYKFSANRAAKPQAACKRFYSISIAALRPRSISSNFSEDNSPTRCFNLARSSVVT